MLGQQRNIARVEPLGFVEVRLTSVPLVSPPLEISQRFGNTATIRKGLARLLKVTHCGVVILQAGIAVIAHRHERLAKVGLKLKRSFRCLPCLFAKSSRWLQSQLEITTGIYIRQQRPSDGKFGVQPHGFSEISLRAKRVGGRS